MRGDRKGEVRGIEEMEGEERTEGRGRREKRRGER